MSIEYGAVKVLAIKLERMPLTLRTRLRPVMKAAATSVADQAKSNAAFSSRIPAAISVRSRIGSDLTGVGATVVVSGAKAPEAVLLEYGNLNSRSTTTFRHPVYGGDTWVTQDMHPYLYPALASKRKAIEAAVAAAVESAQATL
jgi:hypothetical protein